MQILLLSQWFDPEPAFKGLAFARALSGLGHKVHVLTGFPNYPGGHLYEGYRVRLRQQEAMEGIGVTRVPLYPSHDKSPVRRVGNYMSFALSAATIGIHSVPRPDVAYVYTPPPTVGLAAATLRILRGAPFVLDIQDLWPDTLGATGMVESRFAMKAVDWLCRRLYDRASRIAVLSSGFKRKLIERGVSPDKIELIYNWCDEGAFCAPASEELDGKEACSPDRFTVVFAGTMGYAQGLSSVLRAAELVALRDSRVQFVFVGGGVDVERLEREAAAMGLRNVKFLPRRPAAAAAALLRSADALLVHLRDDPLFSITIPSKTQAYLAVGRPIVMAVRGDAAALVEEAQAGVCVPPEDPEALARAICALAQRPPEELSEMGHRAKVFYKERLSMSIGVGKFDILLRRAAEWTEG